jgi:Protein of unknown function (DUF1580)
MHPVSLERVFFMSTNILSETTLRIAEAAPIARTSFCSLWRWIMRGVPGPDGVRIRLEAIRVGGKWLTSREALERFAAATTPRFNAEPAPAPRTPTARQRASERAAKRLEQIGI